MNIKKHKRHYFLPVLVVFILSACSEKMTDASITGYNHMQKNSIADFTVDGAMGSNLSEYSGGGKESCCVSIPEIWRPGLKVTVAWRYDKDQGDPNPPPPSQKVEVEIQEYHRPGKLWVHFYDNHQVKIVISNCSIEHPFYPMTDKDKLPWKAYGTKEENIEAANRGGVHNDC